MANFATPFASSGPRRNPTSDERANGFPCGPADQTLFNGLFHRIESELANVITAAGLTPTDASFNQVQQAIAALIDAATGSGETENYLLMSQAIARLPIMPEVLSADGRINITSPANGTVRLPGGVNFLHRGINTQVTNQADFPTVSNRTYHLRWNPTDGFALKNVGDSGYNPDGLDETDAVFDTTYDDMLVARVVTNSVNAPTITKLANKTRLTFSGVKDGAAHVFTSGSGNDGVRYSHTFTHNWGARADIISINAIAGNWAAQLLHGYANMVGKTHTRYGTFVEVTSDFQSELSAAHVHGRIEIQMMR